MPVSGLPSSSASSIGRAIASPVMKMTFTPCRSIVRHTPCPLNSGSITTLPPLNRLWKVAHCEPPWIIGGIG
ncbi:Uncharacterised protein [Mycobacteroides abscessus subsp. abscessus]|nr:Uncharacterised protein [Mycobacteroides abscessus subsp. abscessus]